MGKFRVIVFLLFLLFALGILGSIYFLFPKPQSEAPELSDKLLEKYILSANVTAATIVDAVIDEFEPTIEKYVNILKKDLDITYVSVINKQGKVITSTRVEDKGKNFTEVYKIPLLKTPEPMITDLQNIKDIAIPIAFRAGEKTITVGEMHIGVKPYKTQQTAILPGPFITKIGVASVSFLAVILLLLQFLVFSPLQKKFGIFEKEQEKIAYLTDFKKEEERLKGAIENLKKERDGIKMEIEKLDGALEAKKKELLEFDVEEEVQKLENKKKQLEEEISALNKEAEQLKENIQSDRMEQEELRRRLDVIRSKMKKIMEE